MNYTELKSSHLYPIQDAIFSKFQEGLSSSQRQKPLRNPEMGGSPNFSDKGSFQGRATFLPLRYPNLTQKIRKN